MLHESLETPVAGIDLTSPVAQHQHGMSNLVTNFLKGSMENGFKVKLVVFCTNKNIQWYSEYTSDNITVVISDPGTWIANGGRLDILHHPFNAIFTEIPNVTNVLTVCDLIPLKFRTLYPNNDPGQAVRSCQLADHIITISNSTKYDLINYLGIAPHKITHCITSSDFPETVLNTGLQEKLGLPQDYIVFPAAFRPHKNHKRFLQALAKSDQDIYLALCTGESHNKSRESDLDKLILQLGLKNRVCALGNLERSQYYELVHNSVGLIFPSVTEGFGLPVLEGLIAKKNIACSYISSLIEIADDNAIFFDPYSVEEMTKSINLLWEKKRDIPEKNLVFDKFSIARQTKDYLNVYDKVIKSQRRKYRNNTTNNNESLLSSANALYHSSAFRYCAESLYRMASKIYEKTPISKLIDNQSLISLHKNINPPIILDSEKVFTLMIDVTRLFVENPYSGISNYVSFILKELINQKEIFVIPFYDSKARGFKGNREDTVNLCSVLPGNVQVTVLHMTSAEILADNLGYPVIYFSSYHPLPENRKENWKYCITIFDVLHFTDNKNYPDGTDRKKYITADIINSIKSSDMILPISRYSLRDTLTVLPFTPLASIVYLAPCVSKSPDMNQRRDIDILIPFQRDLRKGFARMVLIASKFLEGHSKTKKLKILFFGKPEVENDPTVLNMVKRFPGSLDFSIMPTEAQLVDLYNRSKCLLYLSESEGFGLPPLEAMSFGCAPIVLDNSSLGEIFSGWQFLLAMNATDEDIMLNLLCITTILNSKTLSEDARKFASPFTWENSKNMHLAAFTKLLQK